MIANQRRNSHHMAAHLPIGFATGAVFFMLVFLLTRNSLIECGVITMCMAGVVFTPIAMLTGYSGWKHSYDRAPHPAVRRKLIFSFVLLAQFVAVVVWWAINPPVLSSGGDSAWQCTMIVLSLLPVMIVLERSGAKGTFSRQDCGCDGG